MSEKLNERDSLRMRAETQLSRSVAANDGLLHHIGTPLQELRLHQIELEITKDKLRQEQIELKKSRSRFEDFYDSAPVGYLTLSRECLIREINLTGATMLGAERNKLHHQYFTSYITPEYRDNWRRYFLNTLSNGAPQVFEAVFLRDDGSNFYAQMNYMRLKIDAGREVARFVLIDTNARANVSTCQKTISH